MLGFSPPPPENERNRDESGVSASGSRGSPTEEVRAVGVGSPGGDSSAGVHQKQHVLETGVGDDSVAFSADRVKLVSGGAERNPGLRPPGHASRVHAHHSPLVCVLDDHAAAWTGNLEAVEIGQKGGGREFKPREGPVRTGHAQARFTPGGSGGNWTWAGAEVPGGVAKSPYDGEGVCQANVAQQKVRSPAQGFQDVRLRPSPKQYAAPVPVSVRKLGLGDRLYQAASQKGLPLLNPRAPRLNKCLYSWSAVLVVCYLMMGWITVTAEWTDQSQEFSQQVFQLKQPLLLSPASPFTVQVSTECTRPVKACGDNFTTLSPEPAPLLDLYRSHLCTQNETLLFCEGLPNTDFTIFAASEQPCEHRGALVSVSRPSCLEVELEVELETGLSGWLVFPHRPEATVPLPSRSLSWKRRVSRHDVNETLWWTLVWDGGACPPQDFVSVPLSSCVSPVTYELNLNPHAKLWTGLMWVSVYSCYLMVLVTQAWHSYPNMAVLSQAVLMATHVPLLADLGFTWYLLTSCAACALPLMVLGSQCLCSVCFKRKYFKLPSTTTTQGVGHLGMYLSVQVATTATALSLQQ